ncbi:MAG TPA: protein-methionine-sulfoxide reductase heme-binding subunit MsrQ [Gemmatimonadaceae bacterium]|nr:protein-methionine-sulfoxide reductase heme-binding subunit MsrQ [Gemmatimonadaceae bacterium]
MPQPRVLKPVAFLLCLVPLGVLAWRAWGVVAGSRPEALGANPIREAEIYTGLWTLRFLAITLAVTPVRRLLRLGVLAKYRRMLGLFTFAYACAHVSLWVGVDWYFDWAAMGKEIAKHKYILVGMTTFVLLLPLALTSTKGWVRRLGGARWARLHQLVYVCAITGTVHYLWAVKKDTLFPLVYLLTFAALLGIRAWERFIGPVRLRPARARPAPRRRELPLAGAASGVELPRPE